MGKATQRGFTLIELVVVIVILGILSAFAVPRFMGLQAKAREAAIDGLTGSLKSAATLAHSVYLVDPTKPVVVDGNTIAMTNGYPDLATIKDTLQESSGFTYDPATGAFSKDGAATPANCSVTYAPPAAAGGSPTYTVDKSKC